MEDCSPPTPASQRPGRTLADIDADALAHCAGFLGVKDVASLAMACKTLRRAAYSDSVWSRLFAERWPSQCVSSGGLGVREQYLARHTALNQMKFEDPLNIQFSAYPIPHSLMLLNGNDIFLAQGSIVERLRLNPADTRLDDCDTFKAHSARITCMRLFPIFHTSLFRREMPNEENVLVTSSSDWTIRLWWKGHSQRCFKGHSGPVTTIAEKLVGDDRSKILASGGEDCTVRLWSFNSSGKRHPLTLTYRGHEKPVSLLSVASHKDSLLISISKDSKVRVWDTAASTSSTSSSCVGMTSVFGPPVGMRCHDTLCCIAAGSVVTAIDLRTMQKAFTVANHAPEVYSFEMLPSKWLICTGGENRAMLWDIRKNQGNMEPVADLDSCGNRVTLLHMDSYKIVTGGPFDHRVNVWETGTGFLANSLDCGAFDDPDGGLSAMAVDGCRIATGVFSSGEEPAVMRYRDFANCSIPVSLDDFNSASKFWEPQHIWNQ